MKVVKICGLKTFLFTVQWQGRLTVSNGWEE